MSEWICFSGALPQVVPLRLAKPDMPEGLVGARALFAADLHYGRWMDDEAMARIVALMRGLKPDVVLLGGDLAEGIEAQQRLCQRHLPALAAPMGVFCVPGNNDREAMGGNYAAWGDILRRAGVTLLFNRRTELSVAGGRLVISGLDESKYGSPSPAVARWPLMPGDVHLLMTHSPWALAAVLGKADAKVDLALCGHTHGGQIALGRLPALAMGYHGAGKRPYFFMSGDHTVDGVRVLVSNGIGCSMMPVRVGAPPQIHLIEFARESGAPPHPKKSGKKL